MEKVGDLFQSSDWKKEKHAPVIECADEVTAGEVFTVKVSVGKEIPHPNTTVHHIQWIQLYFKPEKEPFAYHVGSFEFAAHGESAKGEDKGPAYTHPSAVVEVAINQAGTFYATSYCNIHGLWESSKAVQVK